MEIEELGTTSTQKKSETRSKNVRREGKEISRRKLYGEKRVTERGKTLTTERRKLASIVFFAIVDNFL